MLTKEKFDLLSKWDLQLTTAYKHNYASITRADFNSLLDIYYDNEAEKHVSKSAFNCPKCKLKELAKIGSDYLKFKNDIKNKN